MKKKVKNAKFGTLDGGNNPNNNNKNASNNDDTSNNDKNASYKNNNNNDNNQRSSNNVMRGPSTNDIDYINIAGPSIVLTQEQNKEKLKQEIVDQFDEMLQNSAHAGESKNAGAPMRLGDSVFFEQAIVQQNAGFLCGEGIVSMRLGLKSMPKPGTGVIRPANMAADCQFKILPPLKYDAQRMLKRMKNGSAKETTTEIEIAEMQQRLKNEEERNQFLLQHSSMSGSSAGLLYGQV